MASLLSMLGQDAAVEDEGYSNSNPLFTAASMHMAAAKYSTPEDQGWQLSNIPKAIASIGTSAFSGFYNTGVAVNNFFGGQAEEMDVAESLSLRFDDDYAEYYKQNQGSMDAIGFFAGALIPGLGAGKVLQLGQKAVLGLGAMNTAAKTGKIGRGMELFTKLVVPNTARYVDDAKAAFSATNQAYSLKKKEAIFAAMSGVHGAALEALTAETLILATMYKSPVLEDMSGGEIVKQMAIGTLLGGGIGGLFTIGAQRGVINTALREQDKMLTAVRTVGTTEGLAPTNELLHYRAVKEAKRAEAEILGEDAPEIVKKAYASVDTQLNTAERDAWGRVSDNQNTANVLHQMTADMDFAQFSRNTLDSMDWFTDLAAHPLSRAAKRFQTLIKKTDLLNESSDEIASLSKTLTDYKLTSFNTRTGEWVSPTQNWGLLAGKTPEQIDGIVESFKLQSIGKLHKPLDLDALPVETVDTLYRKVSRMTAAELSNLGRIHHTNIPLLEGFALKGVPAEVVLKDGTTKILNPEELVELVIKPAKIEKTDYALNAGKAPINMADDAMGPAKRTRNTGEYELKEEYTSYMRRHNLDRNAELGFHPSDWSWKSMQDELEQAQRLYDSKGWNLKAEYVPEYITVGTKVTQPVASTEPEVMAYLMNKTEAFRQELNMAVADNLGEDAAKFPAIPKEVLASANRFGAGNGLLSNANGEYNSLASVAEFIGRQTETLKRAKMAAVEDDLTPAVHALLNRQAAMIELSAIDTSIARTGERYVRLNAQDFRALINLYGESAETVGEFGGLVPIQFRNVLEKMRAGANDIDFPPVQAGARKFIPILEKETDDVITRVMGNNARRRQGYGKIAQAEGRFAGGDDVYYPMLRPGPREQKYFHFVINKNLMAGDAGRITMLRASTAEELDQLAAQVDTTRYQLLTNKGSADWKQAVGEYERSEAITDMYFDTSAIRKGSAGNFIPPSDPQVIASRIMEQQKRMEANYIEENVRAQYRVEFDTLTKMGYEAEVTNAAQLGVGKKAAERMANPYQSYIKTMLGRSTLDEHAILDPINKGADKLFSEMVGKVQQYMGRGSKDEYAAERIEELFSQYGFKLAPKDAMTQILADREIPTGILSDYVRSAHKFLAMTVLRLDWLNSVNNAIGTQVLLSAESSSALRKIAAVKVPGQDASMGSVGKLLADAHSDYAKVLGKSDTQLYDFFKANGYIPDVLEQQAAELASMQEVFRTGASKESMLKRMADTTSNWAEKATKLTGNRLSEEYSRFIAAAVGKRLADAQGLEGVMQLSYINTFVNRVAGNVTASQRPLIFSGPVGSMIGLFQSYQFNMIQQLFRYMGEEGGKKSLAIAMGVQASMYGANGLPGFQLMNSTLLTSTETGRDVYQTTHEALGKEVGNFLLYGVPSAATGVSMYTRGDLNPRYATILPNTLQDIPIINATTRVLGNLFDTGKKLVGGADVSETILQGLEHNGLNRPLAGLAASLNGYSTSLKGNMKDAEAQDLFSLANLGRIAGGKPMDSAVANDAVFRIQAYEARERGKLDDLRAVVKSKVIGGEGISMGEYEELLGQYMEAGGQKKNWNKWVIDTYKQATVSQAEAIANDLSKPQSRYMMELLRD